MKAPSYSRQAANRPQESPSRLRSADDRSVVVADSAIGDEVVLDCFRAVPSERVARHVEGHR